MIISSWTYFRERVHSVITHKPFFASEHSPPVADETLAVVVEGLLSNLLWHLSHLGDLPVSSSSAVKLLEVASWSPGYCTLWLGDGRKGLVRAKVERRGRQFGASVLVTFPTSFLAIEF